MIWWLGLYTDGAYRADSLARFRRSAAASFGAAGLHVLSPLTTTLNYSTFEPDGSIDVRLTYDHRVLDGAPIARALTAIEETLNGEIRDELLAGTPARRIHAERSTSSEDVPPQRRVA